VAAAEEEALVRDLAVAGPAAARAGRGVERARVGAEARVQAEVCGKRERPRVEAAEQARAAAEDLAEDLDREDPEVEDPELEDLEAEDPEVEDLEVEDLEAEGPEVVGLEAEDLEVEDLEVEDLEVEDLEAEDLEAEDPEVVDLEVAGQGVVDLEVVGQGAAAPVQAAEDLAEVPVGLVEPVGERGRVENRASG